MLVLLMGLVLVAFVDHRHTLAVGKRASTDAWWCTHRGIRCTGFDERGYEERWERRELVYKLGIGTLAAGSAAGVLFVGQRRRRAQ
jgi:hypothetical protein